MVDFCWTIILELLLLEIVTGSTDQSTHSLLKPFYATHTGSSSVCLAFIKYVIYFTYPQQDYISGGRDSDSFVSTINVDMLILFLVYSGIKYVSIALKCLGTYLSNTMSNVIDV